MRRIEIIVKVSTCGPYGPTGKTIEATRVASRDVTSARLRRALTELNDDVVSDVLAQLRAEEAKAEDDDEGAES